MSETRLITMRFPNALVEKLDGLGKLLPQMNRTQIVVGLLEITFADCENRYLADELFAHESEKQGVRKVIRLNHYDQDEPLHLVLHHMFQPNLSLLIILSKSRLEEFERIFSDDEFIIVGDVCEVGEAFTNCTVECQFYRQGTCTAIHVKLKDGTLLKVTNYNKELLTNNSHLYEKIF